MTPTKTPRPGKIPSRTKESNREHHLTYFKDYYQQRKYAVAGTANQLLRTLNLLEQQMGELATIDINRRDNALRMGVSIHDSDAVYSFADMHEWVPRIIEETKKNLAMLGIKT